MTHRRKQVIDDLRKQGEDVAHWGARLYLNVDSYDKTNGKEVGAVYMPAQQSGTPMTYSVNGRQLIVVPISGGNYSGEYLAFALPVTR